MSDGSLRTCLGQEKEYSLLEALTEGKEAVKARISQAILEKPMGHLFAGTIEQTQYE